MRFLVDARLPPALATWLEIQGHKAEHVGDCGLSSESDLSIWLYADRVQAAIITKDQDFATLRMFREHGPVIVWIRLPNTRRRALLDWFAAVLPRILHAIERGENLIEIVESGSR